MHYSDSKQLKEFLDSKADYYNNTWFINEDPISIPHKFSSNDDIEIAALLTALIAWGNRKAIIKSANEMMQRMDMAPADFVKNHKSSDMSVFDGFKYRTFNQGDLCDIVSGLQHLYNSHQYPESIFAAAPNIFDGLLAFRAKLLEAPHLPRYEKHIGNVAQGSAAKRLNMFLRWMVRRDRRGVDFGLWQSISPALLMLPLDLHSGRVARSLGLLTRNANDWKAVEEVTGRLREFDPIDPAKYDFALFGLGIYEHF